MLEMVSLQEKQGKPQSSFPTGWGDDYDLLANDSQVCPISEARMAEYMFGCHFHCCLEEEPTKFSLFQLLETFHFSNRSFWIWSCKDDLQREWNIIVGQGESPFVNESRKRVWLHGERHAERKPSTEILLREYPEYKAASGKVN